MATAEKSTTIVTLTARAAAKINTLMGEEPAGEADVLRVAVHRRTSI